MAGKGFEDGGKDQLDELESRIEDLESKVTRLSNIKQPTMPIYPSFVAPNPGDLPDDPVEGQYAIGNDDNVYRWYSNGAWRNALTGSNLDGVMGNSAAFVQDGLTQTARDLEAVEFDSLGYWDSGAPGRFTIKKAGWYLITGWIVIVDGYLLYKWNGVFSGIPATFPAIAAQGDFSHGATIRHFNLNDTLDWYTAKTTAGSDSTSGFTIAIILVHF